MIWVLALGLALVSLGCSCSNQRVVARDAEEEGFCGNVRLYTRKSSSKSDETFSFVVVDLDEAIAENHLECAYAPSRNSRQFYEVEHLLLSEKAFQSRCMPNVLYGSPLPSEVNIMLKPVETKLFKSQKGQKNFEKLIENFYMRTDFDAVIMKENSLMVSATFYKVLPYDVNVDELMDSAVFSVPVQSGLALKPGFWEVQLPGFEHRYHFAPVTSFNHLQHTLRSAGSLSSSIIFTSPGYTSRKEYYELCLSHTDGDIFRFSPLFEDIFAGNWEGLSGKRLSAFSIEHVKAKNFSRVKLYIDGKPKGAPLMRWIKSFESRGFGFAFGLKVDKARRKITFKSKRQLMLRLMSMDKSKDQAIPVYKEKDLSRHLAGAKKMFNKDDGLYFGDLISPESESGNLRTMISDSEHRVDAFGFLVRTLFYGSPNNASGLLESISMVVHDGIVYHRLVFTAKALETHGEAHLIDMINNIVFGKGSAILEKYGFKTMDGSGSAETSADSDESSAKAAPQLAAYVGDFSRKDDIYFLDSDYLESVIENALFSPPEVFSSSRNKNSFIVLMPHNARSKYNPNSSKLNSGEEVDAESWISAITETEDTDYIVLMGSKTPRKIIVQKFTYIDSDNTQAYQEEAQNVGGIELTNRAQYFILKPWVKTATLKLDELQTRSPEIRLEVRFHRGSAELVDDFMLYLLLSSFASSVSVTHLLVPMITVSFKSEEAYDKTLEYLQTSFPVFRLVSKELFLVIGKTPLTVFFPVQGPQSSSGQGNKLLGFKNVQDFMKIKSTVKPMVPKFKFSSRSCTIEPEAVDPFFKNSVCIFEQDYPHTKFTDVLTALIKIISTPAQENSLYPLAKLTVVTHTKNFRVSYYTPSCICEKASPEFKKTMTERIQFYISNPSGEVKAKPVRVWEKKMAIVKATPLALSVTRDLPALEDISSTLQEVNDEDVEGASDLKEEQKEEVAVSWKDSSRKIVAPTANETFNVADIEHSSLADNGEGLDTILALADEMMKPKANSEDFWKYIGYEKEASLLPVSEMPELIRKMMKLDQPLETILLEMAMQFNLCFEPVEGVSASISSEPPFMITSSWFDFTEMVKLLHQDCNLGLRNEFILALPAMSSTKRNSATLGTKELPFSTATLPKLEHLLKTFTCLAFCMLQSFISQDILKIGIREGAWPNTHTIFVEALWDSSNSSFVAVWNFTRYQSSKSLFCI